MPIQHSRMNCMEQEYRPCRHTEEQLDCCRQWAGRKTRGYRKAKQEGLDRSGKRKKQEKSSRFQAWVMKWNFPCLEKESFLGRLIFKVCEGISIFNKSIYLCMYCVFIYFFTAWPWVSLSLHLVPLPPPSISTPHPPFLFRKGQASHEYQQKITCQAVVRVNSSPYIKAGKDDPVRGVGSQMPVKE